MEIHGDVNKIIEAIREKAKKHVEEVINEAKKRVEMLKESHKRDLEDLREKMLSKAKTDADIEFRKRVSEAESAWRMKILELKTRLLEDLKVMVYEKLKTLDEDLKVKYIERVLQKNLLDNAKIIPVKGWENAARSVASKYGLDVTDPIEGDGGIILEDVTGKVRIDARISTLLNRFWEDHAEDIFKILIGEE
ncbi:MAG: hypothetical protein DRN30_06210 [Thermoplasmata archaeon]|nr:hypothetical protein [Euryarchaeota archaeon]RLF63733.1 MAG: hypothetical protein DRN30_06210 [Thermoplasmata archaeon]